MAKKVLDTQGLIQTFNKQQILLAKKYKDRTDLLDVLLKNDKEYTFNEVDNLIEKFMKRKVN